MDRKLGARLGAREPRGELALDEQRIGTPLRHLGIIAWEILDDDAPDPDSIRRDARRRFQRPAGVGVRSPADEQSGALRIEKLFPVRELARVIRQPMPRQLLGQGPQGEPGTEVDGEIPNVLRQGRAQDDGLAMVTPATAPGARWRIEIVLVVLGACTGGAMVFFLQQIIPSTAALPVLAAIMVYCASVALVGRVDPALRESRRAAWTFAAGAVFLLAASSALHLVHLHQSGPPAHGYAWESEHLGELARLSRAHHYWMDGHIDEWAFVLFNQGLAAIGYNDLAVMEKGPLYFYAAILRIAGDFNTYLLVVASCTAQLLSAWLLIRISAQFAPAMAAVAAGTLLLVMPDSVYWGSLIHKDNFAVLLLLTCLWSALRAFGDRFSWAFALVFIAALLALAFTRSGLVVPIVGAGALAIVLTRKSLPKRAAWYGASMVAGVAVVATLLPHHVAVDLRKQAADRVYYRLAEGSSYKLDVQNITFSTTAKDSLVHRLSGGDLNWKKLHLVPVRVAMYFVAPFPPWPGRAQVDYFVVLSTWLLVPLWFFFLAGCWSALRERGEAALWALAFFAAIAVAVAFAGGFVHERYRVLLMPFYLAFASLGESGATNRQKAWLLGAAGVTFTAGLALYWTLK